MRNLYDQFRDCVIDDVIAGLIPPRGSITPWDFLPSENTKNIGRMQTIALIRRFMDRLAHDFPGGFVMTGGKMMVNEAFPDFAKTHKEMGSTSVDMQAAWVAMAGMKD